MRIFDFIDKLEAYAKLYGNNEIHFEKYDVDGDHEELSLNIIDQKSDDECLIEFV